MSSTLLIIYTLKIPKQILSFLKSYSFEPIKINRLIVSSFLVFNNLKVDHNKLIKSLIIASNSEEIESLNLFVEIISKYKEDYKIEDLIELFEFVISPADKEVNGAVYTPKYIRDYIVEETSHQYYYENESIENVRFGDISCGCGGFFISFIDTYKQKTNKSLFEIYRDNIFGLDIQSYSIDRSIILLSLYAIMQGEDVKAFDFNLFVGNALNFDWAKVSIINENNGFDILVGNPPYVGASKIDDESKQLLSNWSVSKTGKPDLYLLFFQIGLELLAEKGNLGYITMSSFSRSLNGIGVRKYIQDNMYAFKYIDFGSIQIFHGRRTYTCICIISKKKDSGIYYTKSSPDGIFNLTSKSFKLIPYANLNIKKGWILEDSIIESTLKKIEKTGSSLDSIVEIKNGIATLRNNIYVFKPINETNEYYEFYEKDEKVRIEKEICRNIIKPSILKSEDEIESLMEKIIFPYVTISSNQASLFKNNQVNKEIIPMEEEYFKQNFPLAYTYLYGHKQELSKRDKGNRIYKKWFIYGRSQGLTLYGYKLLFPYISDKPYFVYSDEKDLFYYNGFSILSKNPNQLKILKKILQSKLFWFYVKHISRPYENNYYSLGKRYIRNFGVYNFSEKDQKWIDKQSDQSLIDSFLCEKYDIPLEIIKNI